MKVLLISSEPLNPESIQSSCFELNQAKALIGTGIDVSILAVKNDYSITRILRSLTRRLFKQGDRDSYLRNYSSFILLSFLFKATTRIYLGNRFLVNKYTIDGIDVYESQVQYFRFTTIYSSLKLWKRAGLRGFKVYVDDKGVPDIVHAHNRYMYAGALAYDLFVNREIPYVLTEHSSFYKRNLVAEEDVAVLRSSIESSSVFTIVSPLFIYDIEDKLGPIRKRPIFISNFLDEIFVQKDLKCDRSKGVDFRFVNIANLTEVKGQSILIEAFNEFLKVQPNGKLYIAGDGKLWQELHDLTERLNITSSVTFCGQLNPDDVIALLDSADVFVLPSFYETFGVVVLEALSRGKPSIITRCMGPEGLITASNGMVVPVKDVVELKDAMVAVANKFDTYDPVSIRKKVLDMYHPEIVANKLKAVYQEIIG